MNLDFLSIEFTGNTLGDYLLGLIIFISGLVFIKLLKAFCFRNLKKWAIKTDNFYDDAIIKIIEHKLIPIIYIGIVYLAVKNLTLHPILDRVIEVLAIITVTILGIGLFTASVEYIIKLYWLTYHQNNINIEQSINALIPAIRVLVWLIGIVFLLDNLGFDISAVVASLGIGGVAIALASQGVLQDLFSYFSILLDRPFELGDFIIVGDYLGTVNYVGIKTTRLKSISGEEIVIANTDLTSSRIRNFKRMRQRRIVFKFGLVYDTDAQKLAQIPTLIKEIINNTDNTTYDRAHFSGYGEYSLDFEVVYYINTSDYNAYMDAQQQINLEIKTEFAKHNLEFAYPTTVNYLSNVATSIENKEEVVFAK